MTYNRSELKISQNEKVISKILFGSSWEFPESGQGKVKKKFPAASPRDGLRPREWHRECPCVCLWVFRYSRERIGGPAPWQCLCHTHHVTVTLTEIEVSSLSNRLNLRKWLKLSLSANKYHVLRREKAIVLTLMTSRRQLMEDTSHIHARKVRFQKIRMTLTWWLIVFSSATNFFAWLVLMKSRLPRLIVSSAYSHN